MSRLDDLIKELCPDGVERKPLSECCNVLDRFRKPVTKAARMAGEYPYYGANGIQDYVSEYIFDGKFVLVGEDGSVITANGNPVVNWAEGKIWVNNHAHIIEEIDGVLLRYLYHYLQTVDVTPLIHGNIPKLTGGDFKALAVPVPPLEVQREIVRVLDDFTCLTAELTAELQLRKKQYEYYRNRMLSFDPKVKWMTLGDIGKVSMCKRIMKSETSTEGDVPFYKIGTFGKQADAFISWETFEKYKKQYSYPNKGDILISAAGTIGRTVVFDGEPAYFQDSNIVWVANDETQVLNDFLYYWYQTNPWKVSTGGTIARLYNDNISGAKVPVLPIETQKRLIYVLNHFDAICSDLNIGLPAEIEARHKQYEYYRDLLLTFAETGETILRQTDRQTDRQAEITLLQYVFGYAPVQLSEIAEINRGVRVVKKQLSTEGYPVFQNSLAPMGYYTDYNREGEETYVISAGAAGEIGYSKSKFWAADDCLVFDSLKGVVNKYLYYALLCNHDALLRNVRKASIPRLSRDIVAKTIIQLPSIERQKEIIVVLDRFETLCNDISEGLPAEIQVRKKQYEYYRDKLLGFRQKGLKSEYSEN